MVNRLRSDCNNTRELSRVLRCLLIPCSYISYIPGSSLQVSLLLCRASPKGLTTALVPCSSSSSNAPRFYQVSTILIILWTAYFRLHMLERSQSEMEMTRFQTNFSGCKSSFYLGQRDYGFTT